VDDVLCEITECLAGSMSRMICGNLHGCILVSRKRRRLDIPYLYRNFSLQTHISEDKWGMNRQRHVLLPVRKYCLPRCILGNLTALSYELSVYERMNDDPPETIDSRTFKIWHNFFSDQWKPLSFHNLCKRRELDPIRDILSLFITTADSTNRHSPTLEALPCLETLRLVDFGYTI
jgi:hypothetical protein